MKDANRFKLLQPSGHFRLEFEMASKFRRRKSVEKRKNFDVEIRTSRRRNIDGDFDVEIFLRFQGFFDVEISTPFRRLIESDRYCFNLSILYELMKKVIRIDSKDNKFCNLNVSSKSTNQG